MLLNCQIVKPISLLSLKAYTLLLLMLGGNNRLLTFNNVWECFLGNTTTL